MNTFYIGLFTGVFIGMFMGSLSMNIDMKNNAIKADVAHYDSKTGEFTYIKKEIK